MTAPMVDTLTIYGDWPLRTKLPGRRKLALAEGVRIWADTSGAILQRAECSLPRLLFGHNGKALANQGQLDAGLCQLHAELSRIADVPDVAEWQPWRVDLAWNFDSPARPLVLAHAPLRVPGIQSEGTLHPGCNGVSWRGAKSRFGVTLYDKARQMRLSGSVLRAEISLRGEQLSRRLSGSGWRDFTALWRTYRNIMVSIPPIQKPTKAAHWQEAVGGEALEVRQRVLARLAHKPGGTFRRYRRRIEAAAAQLPETFSWAAVLPVAGPPPPMNVEPRKQLLGRRGEASAQTCSGFEFRTGRRNLKNGLATTYTCDILHSNETLDGKSDSATARGGGPDADATGRLAGRRTDARQPPGAGHPAPGQTDGAAIDAAGRTGGSRRWQIRPVEAEDKR